MERRFWVGTALFLVWVMVVRGSVAAATSPILQIRALMPQPETGESEWILVERIGALTASASAEIRDTHGSTKKFSFLALPDQQWYWISATMSAITLNNDQDGVELFLNGELQDRTDTYSGSRRGEAWTRLDSGWLWLAMELFWSRFDTGDWKEEQQPEASPSPTPTTMVMAGQVPAPAAAKQSGVSTELQSSPLPINSSPYPGKPLSLVATGSGVVAQATPVGPPPEPDFAAEKDRYTQWLHWWRRASFAFAAVSVLCAGVSAPWWRQKLQKLRQRRFTWPLLS